MPGLVTMSVPAAFSSVPQPAQAGDATSAMAESRLNGSFPPAALSSPARSIVHGIVDRGRDCQVPPTDQSTGSWKEVAYWGLLVLVFLSTRWWYHLQGVTFQWDTIYGFMQFLDLALLKDRLIESLWYLHAQPPLMNLVTGLALKAAPDDFPLVSHGMFLVVALCAMVAMVAAARTLGLTRWPSFVLGVAFCSVPQFVVFENWYFYPHLCLSLLVGAACCFLRSGARGGPWMSAGFWMLAALVGIRSVYHPVFFFGAVMAAVALAQAGQALPVARRAAGPVLMVVALLAKNLLVLGLAGTSSWGGISVHKVATDQVSEKQLAALVTDRTLSSVSLERGFDSPDVFKGLSVVRGKDRGVAALDVERKSVKAPAADEYPVNFNHWVYLETSPHYLADAATLARRFPGAFVDAVKWNAGKFLEPVLWDRFLIPNRNRVYWFSTDVERVEAALMPLFPVLFLYGLWAIFRRRTPPGERLFLAFSLGAIAWVTALALLVEIGENNRFRYEVMGLVVLVAAWGTKGLLVRLWELPGRLRPRSPSP